MWSRLESVIHLEQEKFTTSLPTEGWPWNIEMPLHDKPKNVWEDLGACTSSNPKLSPSDSLHLGIISPEPISETVTTLRGENK